MSSSGELPSHIDDLLRRMNAGDTAALDDLIRSVNARIQTMAHRMLADFRKVHRWEETGDVAQEALLRLVTQLRESPPSNEAQFYRLAARMIRHELIDLARHYDGANGPGRRHASNAGQPSDAAPLYELADLDSDPAGQADWLEQMDRLDDEEREVIDLLFICGLKPGRAATLLGVTVRTVQNRRERALARLRQG